MLIVVQNNEIETKDIKAIVDTTYDKHGFVILLLGNQSIEITKNRDKSLTNEERRNIDDRFDNLRIKVEREWRKDMTEVPLLNIID
jgi:hypothetical protein